MTVLNVEVICPVCGTPNERREVLVPVTPDCTIAPVEVIRCRACRAEIGPDVPDHHRVL